MRKKDLLWLLAYPIYQLVGTFRHEGAHALSAWLQGAHIIDLVFWPSVFKGHYYWGYTLWMGSTTWLTTAAPYFFDLLTFCIFLWVCLRGRFKRRWVWLNLAILGIASPLLNSAYNYFKGVSSQFGDVLQLLQKLPPPLVHTYFVLTLALYTVGLVFVLQRGPRQPNKGTPS